MAHCSARDAESKLISYLITYRLLISKHVHEIGKHVKMTGGAQTFYTDKLSLQKFTCKMVKKKKFFIFFIVVATFNSLNKFLN
jgi:hypothetical protein